jgi:hypothetical protein
VDVSRHRRTTQLADGDGISDDPLVVQPNQ